jgi:tetratricopeptide (TPR) repeat protein
VKPFIILRSAGILVLGFAAVVAIRLGVAETIFRRDMADDVQRAIALQGSTPSAAFEERLAELEPSQARIALEKAVAANPRASSGWIALGLLEESSGYVAVAEESLLRAARVDQRHLPAWTLANFYFRRGNQAQFWVWAARAASLTYDDFRPLLRLGDALEADPARLLAHFDDAPRLRAAYLDFLIAGNRLKEAQQVANSMSSDRANDPHLIDLADRQLRAGNAGEALQLWNIASGFPPLDPGVGRILTNGDLSHPPQNLGFDWRLLSNEGVAESWKPAGLVFILSGSQPESCVLLEQTMLVVPRQLRLRFSYRGQASGMRWAMNGIEGHSWESGSEWKEGLFSLPRGRGLAALKLVYQRDPGTTRTEGRVELRDLRLEVSS